MCTCSTTFHRDVNLGRPTSARRADERQHGERTHGLTVAEAMQSKFGKHSCALAILFGALACANKTSQSAGAAMISPPVETSQPPEQPRLKKADPFNADSVAMTEVYATNLERAPHTYEGLEATLDAVPPSSPPHFDVRAARFFDLVTTNLKLGPKQLKQLAADGAISLQLPKRPTMGSVYAALWQADMPVLITTDSILHAWHKTYDSVLQGMETSRFTAAYRDLLRGIRTGMDQQLKRPSPKLQSAARQLDLYVSVALTLLPDAPGEDAREPSDQSPPELVSPLLVSSDEVEQVVRAIYELRPTAVPVFGEVDFSQFKPRGHYTKNEALQRYFRAVMWMGRADTGFPLGKEATARVALMMGLLAEHSGQLPPFQKTQSAIDYFVGTSNGLSLVGVAEVLRKNNVTRLTELEDDARVQTLTRQLLAATPKSRVTSQALPGHAGVEPPSVFQLSSQRFTLDSFIHQQVSFGRIPKRTMVSGLDVFAALGNSEAVRLLEPELKEFDFSRQMAALRRTTAELPAGYWQQNIYTRWFDALRTLDDTPEGGFLPDLFRSRVWQRKQLNNQLASWAELRRDTILYVAQVYGGILCEFPDVYLEPYPAFFERMHDMALEAEQTLEDPASFRGFVDVMNNLSDIARRQLSQAQRNEADRTYLRSLVRSRVLDGGCGGPEVEWSGWYSRLFPGDMFDYEPVIADVFTDPNSGSVLNVATTGPDMLVAAVQTQEGPTLFAGPIASYRQFVGGRLTDEEWEEQIGRAEAPARPAWHTLHAGGTNLPQPHR
jgi:Protein of unknown function (DUF3160)